MCRRATFPAFAGMSLPDKMNLIRRAHLRDIDRRIAVGKLIYDMDYVDIGAEVGLERSSVAYRMKEIIVPKLVQWKEFKENAA